VLPVARTVPVVTGEIGESDCAGGFVDPYMAWADSNGVSYLAWTWDTWDCRSGPALITDYAGTPTAFGAAVRSHLAMLTGPPMPVPAPHPLPGSAMPYPPFNLVPAPSHAPSRLASAARSAQRVAARPGTPAPHVTLAHQTGAGSWWRVR
jgi:hypothetical protein